MSPHQLKISETAIHVQEIQPHPNPDSQEIGSDDQPCLLEA